MASGISTRSWQAVAGGSVRLCHPLVACPIRYWPFQSDDGAWRFALNYGPAHGLKAGIDTVFTTGPLAHLTFPECVGANRSKRAGVASSVVVAVGSRIC